MRLALSRRARQIQKALTIKSVTLGHNKPLGMVADLLIVIAHVNRKRL